MTERETLLAEIAEKQARLAEIDAEPEPDWSAAVDAYCKATGLCKATNAPYVRKGLIAAFAKAPPMGSVMGEAEIEALARECLGGVLCAGELFTSDGHFKVNEEKALANLSKTLSRVQPMGECMTDAEIWTLACELSESCSGKNREQFVDAVIRETLSRVQPRWPSEAELQETRARFYAPCACGLVDVCGYHRSKQFHEDSRRIRAYQTGQQP
jgi:hypothetical protein